MIHYKPVKITINVPNLAKVIIDVIVHHHLFLDSTVTNKNLLLILKFWVSLYYFLGIKRQLFIAFYSQTNGQTIRWNSTIEVYLWTFISLKKSNRARLLPIVEFTYNNAKNATTSHSFFGLNCNYYFCVSFKKTPILTLYQKLLTNY